jgi:hypothetical protein
MAGWCDPPWHNDTASWRIPSVYTLTNATTNLTGTTTTIDYGRRGQSPPTMLYVPSEARGGPEPRNRKERRALAHGLPRYSVLLWATLRASEKTYEHANALFWPQVLRRRLPRPCPDERAPPSPPRRRRRLRQARSK